MSSAGSWIDGVITHNRGPIEATAARLAETHQAGGLIYTAGSGHSLAMVMETFFRAGGLAIVKPLFRPELLPLNGALRATEVEREVGIGRGLVTAAGPEPRDSVIVFSNSGRNPYPVEIAEESRRHGAAVIAFTSVEASRQSDPRATRRLYEVADIILDTWTPVGDVSRPPGEPVTSPLSTLSCCALWTEILAAVVELDPTMPLWRSANQDGNDGFNQSLTEQLRSGIPEL